VTGVYPDGCTQADVDRAAGGYEERKDGIREYEDRPAIYGESQIHFDSGDIDDHGRWWGEAICCIACKETSRIRIGLTRTYMVNELFVDECGCVLVCVDRLYGGVRL
jgi:hypothetical protein